MVDAEVHPQGRPLGRQRRGQPHPQRQGGNADQELDDALDHGVHRPTDVAGDAAYHHPQQEADGDPEQPHRQRHAAGVKHPREHVAAQLVGAEQVQSGGRQHPEQVQVGADEAQQLVGVGAHEEADAVRVARCSRCRYAAGSPDALQRVDERSR